MSSQMVKSVLLFYGIDLQISSSYSFNKVLKKKQKLNNCTETKTFYV